MLASHAGIDSNVRTSLHSTESCERRGSPSVKRPKSSRSPEQPCKPGAYGTTASISVLMWPRSFQSGPGLAFLHRLVIAFHVVCVEVGACGIRLVCLFLHLTGLDRFVAASYGAQQQVSRRVEEAIVVYHQDETARLATDMPRKDLTVTQDETFTGGLCLITMDPESNFILLEQLAQARDQASWHGWMAPALAQLNCQVIQSTSDEAPGLLAYVEHYLEAHHSPDLFHVQHE